MLMEEKMYIGTYAKRGKILDRRLVSDPLIYMSLKYTKQAQKHTKIFYLMLFIISEHILCGVMKTNNVIK